MLFLLSVVLLVVLVSMASVNCSVNTGKAVLLYSTHSASNSNSNSVYGVDRSTPYQTRFVTVNQLVDTITRPMTNTVTNTVVDSITNTEQLDFIGVLRWNSEDNKIKESIIRSDLLRNTIANSHYHFVFTNVHDNSDPANSAATVTTTEPIRSLLKEKVLTNAETIKISKLVHEIKSNGVTVTKNKHYEIVVSNSVEDMEAIITLIQLLKERNVNSLLIAYEEPTTSYMKPTMNSNYDTLLPKINSKVTRNNRNLATEKVNADIYFEPEGTEFSIYYANTYLYITPDIFTGLLTGLFISAVLFIGLNCLGSVQGMYSFAEKSPTIGREN